VPQIFLHTHFGKKIHRQKSAPDFWSTQSICAVIMHLFMKIFIHHKMVETTQSET